MLTEFVNEGGGGAVDNKWIEGAIVSALLCQHFDLTFLGVNVD